MRARSASLLTYGAPRPGRPSTAPRVISSPSFCPRSSRGTLLPSQRAFNSVVVMVLFIFPSLVRRKRRFPLEIRRHRDPLPLVPGQPEVLVLELVRESDVARVLEAGAEVEVIDPRPVDGARAHGTGRSVVDVASLKHLCPACGSGKRIRRARLSWPSAHF